MWTFNSASVRIKSWESQLKKTLDASNFVYKDIVMDNVQYPIVDQDYCPHFLYSKKVCTISWF